MLRDLYRPLQPTIGNDSTSIMRYNELSASDAMKPYIYCYWVLWSEAALHSSFAYQIVSDGCVDLLINCTAFERLIVAGTTNTATNVEFNGNVEYFGIRFLPGCFHYFFPLPLKDVANKMVPCQDVWGNHLNELESRLFSARSTQERIDIAESYLLRLLVANNPIPDRRFWTILEQMYQQYGNISIERNPANKISPRQLRRLFGRYIGISPKTFARIVRFQSVLRAMKREPKKKWGTLYIDFGYYDQAHFIHEFKDFFGLPPMSVKISQK